MAQQANQEQDLNHLLKVRREKLSELQAAGRDPFLHTTYDVTHHSQEIRDQFDALEGKEVSVAGRMMSKRVMGKASFCHIQDIQGQIQCYVARDNIGEEDYKEFKKMDIGDIIGVVGTVFTTKTGEISIHVTQLTLLCKSLQVLPEKFHGLTNTDLRYRQRYVDLIMNEDVKKTFITRSHIISSIRRFLDAQGFLEVETPMLVSNAGGAAARPFETHFNALNEDFKLRISLELYLKRLIVGGLERVYEIGRVFRNEGLDTRHNPEFTLMELYQAYTDYNGMMDLTERMYRHVAQEVLGTTTIVYNGVEMDLGKPFERITMVDAVKKYADVDFDAVATDEEAKALAKEHNIEFEDRHKKGDILSLFFEEYAEEHLIQPTFVIDHPIEISPLTKKNPRKPGYVERFEMFMNGWEMCNAYSELNDPIDQRERFRQQDANAEAGDEEAQHTDEDFLNALEIGMPPTGGIGYGIDRLCMLFTDSAAIRDVLLFPTMKSLDDAPAKTDVKKAEPKDTEKDADPAGKNPEDAAREWEERANRFASIAMEQADRIATSAKEHVISASNTLAALADRLLDAMSGKTKAPEETDAGTEDFFVNDEAEAPDFSAIRIEPMFENEVDFDTFSKSDFRAVKVKDCIAVPKSKKLLQFTLDDGTGTDRTILSGIHEFYEPEELIGKTCVAITNLPPRKMMGIDSCGMLISAIHYEGEEEKLHLLMLDPSIPAGAKMY